MFPVDIHWCGPELWWCHCVVSNFSPGSSCRTHIFCLSAQFFWFVFGKWLRPRFLVFDCLGETLEICLPIFTRPSLFGWWFGTFVIFHFIYGMSSFPLTNSIIFQDGYWTTNQIYIEGMIHNHYQKPSHPPIPIHSLLSTSKWNTWNSLFWFFFITQWWTPILKVQGLPG